MADLLPSLPQYSLVDGSTQTFCSCAVSFSFLYIFRHGRTRKELDTMVSVMSLARATDAALPTANAVRERVAEMADACLDGSERYVQCERCGHVSCGRGCVCLSSGLIVVAVSCR